MNTELDFPWPLSSDPLNGMDTDSACAVWPKIPASEQKKLIDELFDDRITFTGAYIRFLSAVYLAAGESLTVKPVEPEQTEVKAAQPKVVTPDAVIPPQKGRGRGRLPVQLSMLAPLPTDFTRLGPFFPSEVKDFGEKRKKVFFGESITLVKNSWGELTYTGPRLTISHEDMFLVVLAAIVNPQKRRPAEKDGLPTYKYRGSMRELLVAKGIKNPVKSDYDQAFSLLENMSAASISYKSSTDKCRAFEALVSKGAMNDQGDLEIVINPFFAEVLIQQGVATWMDLKVRNKIKSAYGKAIYRFMSGQNEWSGNISVLAEVLNCSDCRLPDFRRNIRNALKEMISKCILSNGSCIVGNRIVLKRGALMSKIRLPQ